ASLRRRHRHHPPGRRGLPHRAEDRPRRRGRQERRRLLLHVPVSGPTALRLPVGEQHPNRGRQRGYADQAGRCRRHPARRRCHRWGRDRSPVPRSGRPPGGRALRTRSDRRRPQGPTPARLTRKARSNVRRFRWCPNRLMALALIIAAGGGGAALALARPAGLPVPTGREAPGAARTPSPAPPAPAVPGEAFAPATPVRIDIPSIAVSAPVDPVGLNPDGSLQAPKDFDRAGYYTGRPTPGEIGPAIIEGHVDSPRRPAV